MAKKTWNSIQKLNNVTKKWSNRNRFLAAVLCGWGIITFSCWVPRCKEWPSKETDWDSPELLAASAFIIGFASFSTVVLLSLQSFMQIAKYVAMGLLVVGGLLHIVGGILYVMDMDDVGTCDPECDLYYMGGLRDGGILWPAFTAYLLAIDLWKRHLDELRYRVIVFSSIMLLVALLFVISMEWGWDMPPDVQGRRMVYVGMIFIMIGSIMALIVIGIVQKKEIKIFNFICGFLLYAGWILMICADLICQSTFVACWILLGALVSILAADAQQGGTVKWMKL